MNFVDLFWTECRIRERNDNSTSVNGCSRQPGLNSVCIHLLKRSEMRVPSQQGTSRPSSSDMQWARAQCLLDTPCEANNTMP
jgi:hypothetical protein